jgi:hypothetical protein
VKNGEACTEAKRKAKSRAAVIVKREGGALWCKRRRGNCEIQGDGDEKKSRKRKRRGVATQHGDGVKNIFKI